MSILNVAVYSNQAIITTDTLVDRPDGSTVASSKMAVVPHLNMVLAARGLTELPHHVARYLTECQSFDEAVSRVRTVLPKIAAATLANQQEANVPEGWGILQGQELAVVGWSPRDQRMAAILLESPEGELNFTHRELQGAEIAPYHSESLADVLPTDPSRPWGADDWVRLAKRQVEVGLREDPGKQCYGGHLVMAHLTARGVGIATVAAL